MDIYYATYEELPEEKKEDFGPPLYDDDDGTTYLVVEWNDGSREVFSDRMEPEDVMFGRDLSWILPLVTQAYKEGFDEGGEEKS